MKNFRQGRFSPYLRPISFSIDVLILILIGDFILFKSSYNLITFTFTIILVWAIISSITKFYEVYRFTKEISILTLLLKQLLGCTVISFAYVGWVQNIEIYKAPLITFLLVSFGLIAGMWEIPMTAIKDVRGGTCAMADGCYYDEDADAIQKIFTQNFLDHYTGDKTPFPLFFHSAWFFNRPHRQEGFFKFIDSILALPDVYFVTSQELVSS